MQSLANALAVLVTLGCFALTAVAPPPGGFGGRYQPPADIVPQNSTPSSALRPTPTLAHGRTSTNRNQPVPTTIAVPQPSSITTGGPPPGSITTEVPTYTPTTSSPPQSTNGGSSGNPGRAQVINACSFPVYVVVCSQNPATCSGQSTLAANSGIWSQAYAPGSAGGQSIKISTTPGAGDILQFEYTNQDPILWYDISEVNGNPFGPYGFTMTSTDSTCGQGRCAPPATSCPAIFTDPTNGVPYRCGISAGVGVTLCG
ncbi:hypothetical protein N7G274_010757 [Stereocaulon virgatum]|uniref:Thaumatin-like protein n=1 Tax=Stereocaulon virgatum TaxID=373712 RepID=A0ABR3ZWW3_9LECA